MLWVPWKAFKISSMVGKGLEERYQDRRTSSVTGNGNLLKSGNLLKEGCLQLGPIVRGSHFGSFLRWQCQVSPCSSLPPLLSDDRAGWVALLGGKWMQVEETRASCKARGGYSSMQPLLGGAGWGCASTIVRCLQPVWRAGEVAPFNGIMVLSPHKTFASCKLPAKKEGADAKGLWGPSVQMAGREAPVPSPSHRCHSLGGMGEGRCIGLCSLWGSLAVTEQIL